MVLPVLGSIRHLVEGQEAILDYPFRVQSNATSQQRINAIVAHGAAPANAPVAPPQAGADPVQQYLARVCKADPGGSNCPVSRSARGGGECVEGRGRSCHRPDPMATLGRPASSHLRAGLGNARQQRELGHNTVGRCLHRRRIVRGLGNFPRACYKETVQKVGVVRPLGETAGGPNAPRPHNPG